MLTRLRAAGGGRNSAVIALDAGGVRIARARAGGDAPQILSYGEARLEVGVTLAETLKRFRAGGVANGTMLLAPDEYQLLVVDAPDVPAAELKSAARWKLKDILSFPVDEASFDVLAIPGPGGTTAQPRSLFAVVARRDLLRGRVQELDRSRFRLSVIDVPEMAQRNVAALFEEQNRGLAWLYINEAGGLMTVSSGGELYHARRFDLTYADILAATGEAREELFNRVLLDLQRTLDNFERQFSFVTLTKVMVGPEPQDSGLVSFLAQNLAVAVEEAGLDGVLRFADGVPERQDQWRFFHLFGCALRPAGTMQ